MELLTLIGVVIFGAIAIGLVGLIGFCLIMDMLNDLEK